MKKLQREIVYVLSIILIVTSLVACGNSNENGSDNKPNSNENTGSVTTESESKGDEVAKGEDTENNSEKPSGSEVIDNSEKTENSEEANESEKPSESQKPVESEKPSESQKPTESEKPSESQKPTESEKPSESQKPAESEKPSESQKPTESEKPSESQKPAESEKPSESQKPAESEKPSESQKPTETPKPSEPEAVIPSSAPGWDKVPNFKGSSLTEKEMAVKIVECIIGSSMNDFQRVLEIHDWLIFNVDYDHTYSNYHAKNAFVDRRCVCQGYAEAFELLAEAAGLEATYVSGVATNSSGKTESHAWNQVKVNGKWYNVDVTWDDPTKSGKEFDDHSGNGYDYFLVSKAQLEKDHKPDSYKEGEKTCDSNYDRVTILKTAANSGRYGDVAVVTNVSEANAGIKKYMDKNKTEMTLWIYDTSVSISSAGAFMQNFMSNLQYKVGLSIYYPSNSGMIKCPIGITPSSEWDKIPVVKNVDEFKTLLDKNGDAGIETYEVRYEATSGTPVVEASKYGFSISYSTYNGGNWWLVKVTVK